MVQNHRQCVDGHQQGDSSRKSMQTAVITGQHCLIYLLISGQCKMCKNRYFLVIRAMVAGLGKIRVT